MEATVPPSEQPGLVESPYPVSLTAHRQEEYSRFLPLVKWLLLIPHYVALLFLGLGTLVVMFIAFFAVVITAKYPRGLFNYMVGVYRWGTRVAAYLYLATDKYPPFSLGPDPEYPVQVEIAYPERVSRWRPFFAFIIVYPYVLVAGIIGLIGYIAALFAFFTILFTKKFPEGLFEMVIVSLRWGIRGGAYGHYLVTKYPPFSWK